MTRLYYDSEFTGLHQATTLISIGLCSEDGAAFYAEFSDYDADQCDDWLRTQVVTKTRWLSRNQAGPIDTREEDTRLVLGNRKHVRRALSDWLGQWPNIEIWSDCLAYDWVLFCELFGGARHLPANLHYIPLDLATALQQQGLDPDLDRADFAGLNNSVQHNALDDARIIRACHQKLLREHQAH